MYFVFPYFYILNFLQDCLKYILRKKPFKKKNILRKKIFEYAPDNSQDKKFARFFLFFIFNNCVNRE